MRIGLFGCGAYGLALSSILTDNKCEVTMWTKFEEEKQMILKERKNSVTLPNFVISDKVNVTTSIEETIKDQELLIIAIPAAFIDSYSNKGN